MQMAVEGSVDLPVIVAIKLEGVPQEHKLGLQAAFIIDSSGPVHISRYFRLLIVWDLA
jgi:hypothetical protein